jgi:hypothetical protein
MNADTRRSGSKLLDAKAQSRKEAPLSIMAVVLIRVHLR